MMKRAVRIACVVTLLGLCTTALAVVPSSMSVQGRLTDGSGSPLLAGSKTLTFKIYSDPTGAFLVWPDATGEVQTVTSDGNGLWTTRLGALKPLTEDIFADTTLYLEVTVDDGVNPPTAMPLVRLTSGPYAHRVATVDGATGGEILSKVTIGPGNRALGLRAHAVGENNKADGDYSVAFGILNESLSDGSSVTGGINNEASDTLAHVGGGSINSASAPYTVVGGGQDNTNAGRAGFIGAGLRNDLTEAGSVIAGGHDNSVTGFLSAVVGGEDNECINSAGFIGGGRSNTVTNREAAIVGGVGNEARGLNSFIGGGQYNIADGSYSVVGGGGGPDPHDSNAALGDYSTVPGGSRNKAIGDYSFAGGQSAQATHSGSFVWGGSSGAYSSAPEQFIVRAPGGVGITTNIPLGPLHVQEQNIALDDAHLQEDDIIAEDDDAVLGLYSGEGGVAGSGIALGEVTSVEGLIDKWAILRQTSGGGAGLRITYGSSSNPYANTTVMHLEDNGNVGIGTTSPSNRITLPNSASSSGRGLANRWDTYSSRRWKHDIETIDNAVETVEHLRGVTFKWNENDANDLGLIAEEVGDVLPEVVQYEDNGVDAQSVDYARLVAVLIEAVKEQQQQIDRLESEMEQMRQ
ncbi:MAG: hypothetical protein GF341_11695 [candidate division Zixibacteria bacterium]|nr:hypothetical protein [candidate division Zixibacteria bacterium]